ncbi:MAG: CoA transferase [Alphaproteobacteria bacterium]
MRSALRGWSATYDRDPLVAMLRAAGWRHHPILSAAEQRAHPHFRARRIWQRVEHPLSGPEDLYTAPWHLATSRPCITRSAPLLGQHNAEVMGELLGMDEGEIAALTEAGVIA